MPIRLFQVIVVAVTILENDKVGLIGDMVAVGAGIICQTNVCLWPTPAGRVVIGERPLSVKADIRS
jgi:hypothetical protein